MPVQIDAEAVARSLEELTREVDVVRSLKTKLTAIGSTAQDVSTALDGLKIGVLRCVRDRRVSSRSSRTPQGTRSRRDASPAYISPVADRLDGEGQPVASVIAEPRLAGHVTGPTVRYRAVNDPGAVAGWGLAISTRTADDGPRALPGGPP